MNSIDKTKLDKLSNLLYEKIQNYLHSFSMPINYKEDATKLSEISEIDSQLHNCQTKIKIAFKDSEIFGKLGSVADNNIIFNSLRFSTLQKLKIDCNKSDHLKKLYVFYDNYNVKSKHDKYEVCLYEFIKKHITLGYQEYLESMGSYKTIQYDIISTLFHEDQHVFQKEYIKYLDGTSKFPSGTQTILLIWTMLFHKMWHALDKNKINFNYKRENYSFPIEFDARYASMVAIDKIKNKSKELRHYISSSGFFPKDFNSKKEAEHLFKSFDEIYDIYKDKISTDCDIIYNKLGKYSTAIKLELEKRFKKMLSIIEKNKEKNKE